MWPGGDWDQGLSGQARKRKIGSGKRFGTRKGTGCVKEHERSKGWTVEKK